LEYLYGVSPLRAYFESVRGINVGKEQSTKQAKNGGTFGFVSPKNKEDQLDKPQKDQLKQRMIDGYSSNDSISRIFPSSISLDWTPVGLSSTDLQLLEYVGASEEDIYRAYHWPLQFHNQKASTSNNQATAVKQGIYDAVAPLCDIFGEALTVFLAEGFGVDVIEFDYTQLPEMAVNMKDVAAYLSALPKGVITYNEMRTILKYGEIDLPYMNEHYVDAGLTTLKRVFEDANTTAQVQQVNPPLAASA
jgi:phage portal protein BeeE